MQRILRSTLVATALLAAPLAVGQAQMTFGGFAGVNFSDLDVTNLSPGETLNSRTGFMVGGWIGKNLSRMFTIRLEGYWTQKGADLVDNGTTVGSFKLSYIEVPLVVRFNIPLVVVKPAIYAGPAISFKTGCDVEVTGGGSGSCADANTNLKSTDFSGIIGAGVGVGPVTIDVQYDMSLSNILDQSGVDSEVKNQTWTVRAAFGI